MKLVSIGNYTTEWFRNQNDESFEIRIKGVADRQDGRIFNAIYSAFSNALSASVRSYDWEAVTKYSEILHGLDIIKNKPIKPEEPKQEEKPDGFLPVAKEHQPSPEELEDMFREGEANE